MKSSCTIHYAFRDTTSLLNELCETMSLKNLGSTIYLYLDEVTIQNPKTDEAKELLGNVPFLLGHDLFPWSNLCSHGVRMMVCVNPESKDLVKVNDDNRAYLVSNKPKEEKVKTIAMLRVFRGSNAIGTFLKDLTIYCSRQQNEYGYIIDPAMIEKGHETGGEKPIWHFAMSKPHLKCGRTEICGDCFLVSIKKKLKKVMSNFERQKIEMEDITIILSDFSSKRYEEDSYEIQYLRNMFPTLRIESNFEGCESHIIIVIRNGGLLTYSLSNAISRATTHLILFAPDNEGILTQCYQDKTIICTNHAECLTAQKDSSDRCEIHRMVDAEDFEGAIRQLWQMMKRKRQVIGVIFSL